MKHGPVRSLWLDAAFATACGMVAHFSGDAAIAQATLSEDPLPRLTITSRTTIEDAVVTDKNGRAVPGLRKEDFQVFENGKPKTIIFF